MSAKAPKSAPRETVLVAASAATVACLIDRDVLRLRNRLGRALAGLILPMCLGRDQGPHGGNRSIA
jgi:hypothetical protein